MEWNRIGEYVTLFSQFRRSRKILFVMLSDCCCYRGILFEYRLRYREGCFLCSFTAEWRGLVEVGHDKLGLGVSFRWQV